jgi:glyoxylase-like metal-dependent hydrolase (beta-lactamase superfamily II)
METSLEHWTVPVTPFQQNCTVLRCAETGRGALVDPGGDIDRVLAEAARHDVELERVLLTHGHLDHAAGVAEVVRRTELPVEGPGREDAFWMEGMEEQARMFGLPPAESCTSDRWLEHGDTVTVGAQTLEVLHCPGHTPGHVVFFHRPSKLAIVGDVLFDGSIGRTDFPKGNHGDLMRSIFDHLLPLGDDVRFLPGHGPASTLAEQRRSNPFLIAGS